MAGKTAGTKSKNKTVRNTGKSAKTDNTRNKRQFWAIIGFVSGLLILALAIFPGESVWRSVQLWCVPVGARHCLPIGACLYGAADRRSKKQNLAAWFAVINVVRCVTYFSERSAGRQ